MTQEVIFHGIRVSSHTLRKRERSHVQDEKSIPVSKIEVSWAMGDCILYSVPTRYLRGCYSVPSPHSRFYKKGPQKLEICANTCGRGGGSRAPCMGPGVNTCGWGGLGKVA